MGDPSPLARSRYRNSGAMKSLTDLSSAKLQDFMEEAHVKLQKTKQLDYNRGLTASLVQKYPSLEHFVCWTSKVIKGCGVSKSTSGRGSLEDRKKRSFKISVDKDHHFQAHKLMLTRKLGVLYTNFDDKDEESSHLCNNASCWRPSHLHNESHQQNVDRSYCKGFVLDPSTGRIMRICSHTPACEFVWILEGNWQNL